MEEGIWFRKPVDPAEENVPDYFDVIKNPMDLGTIIQNLKNGEKYTTPWDVRTNKSFLFKSLN